VLLFLLAGAASCALRGGSPVHENGGLWDHVPPPVGDAWGLGTRIPTIIVSPSAKRGYVDHIRYDTTSILKLIIERFRFQARPGILRDVGDLKSPLDL
jgi:phospholipase C